jgi:threonyl-tRNA synthetase
MKNSAAYWQGKATNHTLQRVYGVTFPDSKELKQHIFRCVFNQTYSHFVLLQKESMHTCRVRENPAHSKKSEHSKELMVSLSLTGKS